MTETTTPPAVQSYLAQLDAALSRGARMRRRTTSVTRSPRNSPAWMPQRQRVRIEQLGDPFFIAAEAREASRQSLRAHRPGPTPGIRRRRLATDGVGYVLLASLLVALGGMVIPVLGWIAGIVMVWSSRAWSRAEKWAAVLIPLGAVLVTAAIFAVGVAVEHGLAREPERCRTVAAEFYGPTHRGLQSAHSGLVRHPLVVGAGTDSGQFRRRNRVIGACGAPPSTQRVNEASASTIGVD